MSKYLSEMTAFKSYGVKHKQKSQGYQGIVNIQPLLKRYLLMLEQELTPPVSIAKSMVWPVSELVCVDGLRILHFSAFDFSAVFFAMQTLLWYLVSHYLTRYSLRSSSPILTSVRRCLLLKSRVKTTPTIQPTSSWTCSTT